jgi:hypothetical protein
LPLEANRNARFGRTILFLVDHCILSARIRIISSLLSKLKSAMK